MTSPSVQLLVLDAHGVVLNAYWSDFLLEIARRTGEPEHLIHRRWRETLRADAWLGRIEDSELWDRLTLSRIGGDECREALEAGYTLGIGDSQLKKWAQRVPIWLLSNHRSHWLLPRLERFGIRRVFERVLVSDAVASVKPQPEAFRHVIEAVGDPRYALFVDDQLCNVESARRLGMATLHSREGSLWTTEVSRRLALAPRRSAGPTLNCDKRSGGTPSTAS